MLAVWLARRFVFSSPDELFRMFSQHGGKVNSRLWNDLVYFLSDDESQVLAHPQVASRWLHFLMSTAPIDADKTNLFKLAQVSHLLGSRGHLLEAFGLITRPGPLMHPNPGFTNSTLENYHNRKLQNEILNPNLQLIAEPLLQQTTERLKSRSSYLRAWGRARDNYDPDSSLRPAIEPHQQNRMEDQRTLLIEVARDCLKWLWENQRDRAESWCKQHVGSEAPFLRRLAVHTIGESPDISGVDKLDWIMSNCDLHEAPAHHEIFTAAAAAYPRVGTEARSAFIAAVNAPAPSEQDQPGQPDFEYPRYNWFVWLSIADPDCHLVKHQLTTIKSLHHDFEPREHPDFRGWGGRAKRVLGKPSPWSVEEILKTPVTQWLETALAETPEEHDFDPRDQVLDQVSEATKRKPIWGLDLVAELASKDKWSSHLIRSVFDGWCSADLDEATLVRVFGALSAEQLYPLHCNNMVDALGMLLRRNRENIDEHNLTVANTIARGLWNYVPDTDPFQDSDWMTKAINHPAGQLALFWLLSIESWKSTQDNPSGPLSQEYRDGLSEMVKEQGTRGNMARFMLASEFQYLAYVDLGWTVDNIIPLLSPGNEEFGSIWEGMTYCGPLAPEAAELLKEPFLEAIDVIGNEPVGKSQRKVHSQVHPDADLLCDRPNRRVDNETHHSRRR